ncbi:MAG: biotin synthase BioB [Lentisphaerae bacterium]|nr:biotin synthase BioB [Lentisphaerota bacterium]
MKNDAWHDIREAVLKGRAVSPETALAILRSAPHELPDLLAAATRLRRRFFGDRVFFCSILSARSGACTEDCAFCAQSAHHSTGIERYGLRSVKTMKQAFRDALPNPIDHFGIVTSGNTLHPGGVARICGLVRRNRHPRVAWCASLGSLSLDQLKALKAAGLQRFHHNLETAESFFPSICSTHSWRDRLILLRRVRKAGLEICSGGILGLGESPAQRVELAVTLAREKVDSIPVNFLIPVPGTRLEKRTPLAPLDMLRSIVMFRLVHPRAELKVCAGRTHLRELQSLVFYAGATGFMIGPLLTVAGRDVAQDLQLLKDLEIPLPR